MSKQDDKFEDALRQSAKDQADEAIRKLNPDSGVASNCGIIFTPTTPESYNGNISIDFYTKFETLNPEKFNPIQALIFNTLVNNTHIRFTRGGEGIIQCDMTAGYDQISAQAAKEIQQLFTTHNQIRKDMFIQNLAQEIYLAFRSEAGRGAAMERMDVINRVAKQAALAFITKLSEAEPEVKPPYPHRDAY
jgi:hypothetical protein